jgi:hypothetical protein
VAPPWRPCRTVGMQSEGVGLSCFIFLSSSNAFDYSAKKTYRFIFFKNFTHICIIKMHIVAQI